MAARSRIPEPVVERLCRYHRCLARLERQGISNISSQELAVIAGATAEQVRKDLSYFGAFGRRGVGYDVSRLREEIQRIIGVEKPRRIVIIGAGHLGSALAGYVGFEGRGFEIVGIYDNNPARIGHMVQGLRVRNIDRLAEDNEAEKIDIAILAVPEGAAQKVAELVVQAGIHAILNFAPRTLRLPPNVLVRDVDMTAELEFLSFWLSRMENA